MKKCTKCKKEKGLSAFRSKRGKKVSVCRECHNRQTPEVCSQCGLGPTDRITPEGTFGGLFRYKEKHLCVSCLCPDPTTEDVKRATLEVTRNTGGNSLY